MVEHTKQFGLYHWDTFDNETFLKHEADTLDECVAWAEKHYGERLRPSGADRAEIVDKKGNIVKTWNVG
jgi:hypothetical protein